MKLIIEDDEGRKTVVPLVRDEISIGRLEGNTIRLTERNVSRRHARLVRQNGAVYVEDLGSYTGVRVNGERIDGRSTVKEGDLIEIGDYDLQIEGAPSKGEADTNPTVKDDYPHLQPPADKTPPLAVPSPVPEKKTAPQQAAAQPAAPRKSDHNATAVIRLSDLQRSGGGVEERDLGANETPRLVGLSGAFRGKELSLRRSVMKVGRTDDGNDLVIDHQSISRSHGKFQLEDGGWKLYDNKSANGVRVNGEEYGMSPVKPGDTIELGHVKFRFCAPGERFVPPAEAPQSVQASPAAAPAQRRDDAPPAKSKTGLVAGVVGAVVLVAAVGVFFATRKPAVARDENGRTAEEKCVGGQQLIVEKKWPEAIKELQGAKALGTTGKCEVDKLIATAKTEADAKAQLDDGISLLDAHKFKRAIAELGEVSAGSMYGAEAKLKISEAREQGVKALTEDAQKYLDGGKLEDAKAAIEDLQSLSPDAPTLPLLQKALADKKAAVQKASAAPAVKEEKPKEEPIEARNAKAEPLLKGANDKIRGGDLSGGIADLQQVITLKPDVAYMGKAYRNLGVASARAGKTDDAIKYYKKYLELMPDAPERGQLEKLFSDYEKQKGGR